MLSFYNAKRARYFLNNLQIYLNDVLFDTITTIPKNWELYSYYVYPIVGTYTILFKGQDDINDRNIALSNIQFFYLHQESHTRLYLIYLKLLIFTERLNP